MGYHSGKKAGKKEGYQEAYKEGPAKGRSEIGEGSNDFGVEKGKVVVIPLELLAGAEAGAQEAPMQAINGRRRARLPFRNVSGLPPHYRHRNYAFRSGRGGNNGDNNNGGNNSNANADANANGNTASSFQPAQ